MDVERRHAGSQGEGIEKPQMAEEVFKNVQILKGIPVDQFVFGQYARVEDSPDGLRQL